MSPICYWRFTVAEVTVGTEIPHRSAVENGVLEAPERSQRAKQCTPANSAMDLTRRGRSRVPARAGHRER